MATLVAVLSGCAADRPVRVRIDDTVRRPERAAIIFFIDGFGEQAFDEALAEGRLPNITRHLLNRGVRAENAVTCIPSITYAAGVTFLTGKLPGHHGIISNKFFEPSTGTFRNYCHIQTYQDADLHYQSSPTIYEILHDRVTVNIELPLRRGVTHTIDNWATSGLNWWVDNRTGVDCLVAQQFELTGQRASWWHQWPDLIMAYFPATDKIGHEIGPGTEAHHQAIANVDTEIGRICEALEGIGMYDRTYLCLVSDHGMIPVLPDNVLDIPALLERTTGQRVWTNTYTTAGDEAKLLRQYHYAVAISASRWAAVYPLPNVLGDENSQVSRFIQKLDRFDAEIAETGNIDSVQVDPRSDVPPWMAEALAHPAVELAACSFHRGRVHVFTRDAHALIVRSDGPPQRHAVYQKAGTAVFDHTSPPPAPGADEDSDSRAWLRSTARDRYPDFIPQIAAMFDSEHAGNIVFFAAEGWDFSIVDPRGGHGSILSAEMRVPMVFAGPGLSANPPIPYARACDVMPTILHLLQADGNRPNDPRIDIDGVDLLPFTGPPDH